MRLSWIGWISVGVILTSAFIFLLVDVANPGLSIEKLSEQMKFPLTFHLPILATISSLSFLIETRKIRTDWKLSWFLYSFFIFFNIVIISYIIISGNTNIFVAKAKDYNYNFGLYLLLVWSHSFVYLGLIVENHNKNLKMNRYSKWLKWFFVIVIAICLYNFLNQMLAVNTSIASLYFGSILYSIQFYLVSSIILKTHGPLKFIYSLILISQLAFVTLSLLRKFYSINTFESLSDILLYGTFAVVFDLRKTLFLSESSIAEKSSNQLSTNEAIPEQVK